MKNSIIDDSVLKILEEFNLKKESAEDIDSDSAKAIEAIKMASDIINSVMLGRQVDLGYFNIYVNNLYNKINLNEKKEEPKIRLLNNRKRIKK